MAITLCGQTTRVLYLGNSYTGVNNLPQVVYELGLPLGDTISYDSNTPGGYTLEGHSTNSTSINKINAEAWDFVVMQEQSQRPSFHPAQVASDVYPYAEELVDMINANNACTEPVFYMTWGRKNGDQTNCQNYPPLCTYEGMQQRLRESYLEMAVDNDAWCSPVGMAWKATREQYPGIELYNADESHPSWAGSYLSACTFYATFTRKSPVGSTYYATLDSATATILQTIAASTVLDSLDTWNIGVNDPVADFNYLDMGDGRFFLVSGSMDTDFFYWDFGDGNTDEGGNVQHIFENGVYEIMHIASDTCGRSDTAWATVDVFVSAIEEQGIPGVELEVRNGTLLIASDRPRDLELQIFHLNGKLVESRRLHGLIQESLKFDLPFGTYLFHLRNEEGAFSGKLLPLEN